MPAAPIHTGPITFRQYISYQASIGNANLQLTQSPATPILPPQTPGGSLYNPKFTNEHIMNIIKYKALQKLKKNRIRDIERKRKKYKNTSVFLNAKKTLGDSVINTDDTSNSSFSTTSSDAACSQSVASNPSFDRSKLRMRDLLYYNPRTNNSNK